MKMRNLIGLALLGGVLPAAGALGDIVTYAVDPARSSLIVSGPGVAAQSSDSSSLIASYSGSITVNREVGGFQITDSTITAANTGTWAPQPHQTGIFDPPPLPIPRNYGYTITSVQDVPSGPIYFQRYLGLTNIIFSIQGQMNLPSDAFDVSQLSLLVTSGELDYADGTASAPLFSDPIPSSLSLAPATGTLMTQNGVETITIPIEMDITPYALHLSGTIVATAPEPGSGILMTLSSLLLLRRNRRRVF